MYESGAGFLRRTRWSTLHGGVDSSRAPTSSSSHPRRVVSHVSHPACRSVSPLHGRMGAVRKGNYAWKSLRFKVAKVRLGPSSLAQDLLGQM